MIVLRYKTIILNATKKTQGKSTVINNMLKRSRTDFKHLNGKHLDVGKQRVLYCAKVSRYLSFLKYATRKMTNWYSSLLKRANMHIVFSPLFFSTA